MNSRGPWQQALDDAIDRRFPEMVEVRRHLHCNPELSGEERQTTLYLYQRLGDEGFEVRMGPEGRGVVAELPYGGDGRSNNSSRIALRGDIDALRIHDAKQVSYRSQREGVMHACGHDGHTALIYGALVSLSDVAHKLPVELQLRGIFQPSEETCTGACEMIDVGALDQVDAILATHMDPTRHVGRIGLRSGVLTANCDEMKIAIRGRGGHAARPHEARDPIAAAAQLINSLYLFIPRATDSQDAVVVTIGHISGGENANVIPERVVLKGTIRTLQADVRQGTFDHIRRLANGIATATDTHIKVEFGRSCDSVNNDPQLADLLRENVRAVLGDEGLEEIHRPSMGSEDFAFYLGHVPGAMLRLGCASPRVGSSPLHSSTFDMDEEALRIGARILGRAAVQWTLNRAQKPNGKAGAEGHDQAAV